MKFFLLFIILTLANARICNDGITDVHNLIAELYDHINLMETQIRIQYNTFHAERLRLITNQISFLKTLQSGFFTETCKFQNVEEGFGIYVAMNEYFNVIRKNVNFAIKSSVDDLRNENLNIIFIFLQHHTNMVETIAQQSINLFANGKDCVINMEQEIKNFFDLSLRRIMESMRSAAQTSSLNVPSIRTLRTNLQRSFGQIAHNSRVHFRRIGRQSTENFNQTAAANYNNYMRGIFSTVFELGTNMAQVGLDTIAAIEAHTATIRTNVISLNSTFMTPKRVELLGRIKNICAGM